MGGLSMPTFFALRLPREDLYLQFVTREENREHHQFLGATGVWVVSPYTKFEAEACEDDPALFHLKSSFNNKYWVRQSATGNHIVAAADEKEEDRSKWSCTLFRPLIESHRCRLQHMATSDMIRIRHSTPRYARIGFTSSFEDDHFHPIIDWASLVILPKYVAFKADNGKYLSARYIRYQNHLQFAADSNDGSDLSVIHEVSHTPNGRVNIRSLRFNMYWRNIGDWIVATSFDGSALNTVFLPERVDDSDTVILRSFFRSSVLSFVCRRFTDSIADGLSARDQLVLKYSKFEFEECVKSREITDIQYHIQDARFYGDGLRRADSLTATNYDANNDDTATLSYTFTKTISSTWSYSNSVTTHVTTSVKGRIPFVGKVGLEMGISYTHATEHSETTELSEEIEAAYTAVVPGGHSITIFGTVREASAYIPYSYTQIDTLLDGRRVRSRKDDGVYHVQNGYDFYLTRTTPEKL